MTIRPLVRSEMLAGIARRFTDAQARLVLQTADLPLGTLAEMVEDRSIDLEPSFQRRERWPVEKQSALIESFILNVPVPPIYLSEDEYGKYSAIDGKQRLRAISDYFFGRFKLTGLESFLDIEGFVFSSLPEEIRNALRIRPFLRVVTLLRQSDRELKYEVFTRLNRGGEKLNAQELRNVAFRGPLNDLVYELASGKFLLDRLKIKNQSSSAYKEMLDAEYVLRFLTLHEQRGDYSGSLLRSMDLFMLENRNADASQLTRYRRLFRTALSRCESIWGTYAFRRPEGSGWRDQTLAGMYDAQMLASSHLSSAEFENAKLRRNRILQLTRGLFADSRFDQAVRQATNTPSRIKFRVEKIREILAR